MTHCILRCNRIPTRHLRNEISGSLDRMQCYKKPAQAGFVADTKVVETLNRFLIFIKKLFVHSHSTKPF